MQSSPASKLICFAGLGPGEVADHQGRKLVGISQRRTRHAARFQCAVYRRWRPEIADLLIGGAASTAGGVGGQVAAIGAAPVEATLRLLLG